MTSNATPGEIFVRARPETKQTRTATFGRVTRQVRIIGHLGPYLEVFDVQRGGHGEIYFCVEPEGPHPTLPQACKTLPQHVLLNPIRRRAFLRECVLAVQLSALPGFVDCHILSIDGMPVLAMMAFLRDKGGIVNLRDLLNGPPVPVPMVAFLGWCIADSLAMANHYLPGLVHGDLKPENILLQAGVPFIADFGLARTTRHGWGRDTLPGTPAYLAPEARSPDAELTQPTDVFAFGIMLQEMLANAADDEVTAVRDRIADLAGRCTAADPARRPPAFLDIAQELRPMFDESDSVVERHYQARQVLASLRGAWFAALPDGDLASLARLEQWDLVHEIVERRAPEQRTAHLWHFHGLALTRMGRDAEGLESLERALALAEYEIEVNGRAIGYGEPPEAHPLENILYDIAVLLVNAGKYEEAERIGRHLVDVADTPAQTRHASVVVAMAVARMGRLGEADQLLSAATFREENPERLSDAMMLRAELRTQQGRPEAAVELMQRAIQLTPGKARHHRRLGETLMFHLGEVSLAAAAFDHAMLCGDLSEDVLVMRLACAILAAGEESIEDVRVAAELRHGTEAVDTAWPKALELISGAQASDNAAAAAPEPMGVVVERSLDFGNLQIDVNDAGFYTFDFYHPHSDAGYLGRLASRYREMTIALPAILRGTPITFAQCTVCGHDVTTNRPLGSAFTCKNCGSPSSVAPLIGMRYARLREAIGVALDRQEDPVGGHGCCVIVQPRTACTDRQTSQLHDLARRHGLEPVEPSHPAVVDGYTRGISRGFFRSQYEPIGAIYRFPAGSRHAVNLTPAPVEDYLMDVRRLFDVPVDSTSNRIDFTASDVFSLVLADRLDEAEEAVPRDPDVRVRLSNLVRLSYLRLLRGDLAGAARNAVEAVRLDGADEAGWVAKGYAELLSGDDAEAQLSVSHALELNETSSAALALLAAVQQRAGESPSVVWSTLARAVTLGALNLPAE